MFDILLAVTCFVAWGFPFSWKKFRGALEVAWFGYWADLTNLDVGLFVSWAGGLADEVVGGWNTSKEPCRHARLTAPLGEVHSGAHRRREAQVVEPEV